MYKEAYVNIRKWRFGSTWRVLYLICYIDVIAHFLKDLKTKMAWTCGTENREEQQGQPRQDDPMQEILRRLNEQQQLMEELRTTQARQEQERVRQV